MTLGSSGDTVVQGLDTEVSQTSPCAKTNCCTQCSAQHSLWCHTTFTDYCEFCLQNNNNIEDISFHETSLSISCPVPMQPFYCNPFLFFRTPVAIVFGWGGSSHKNVSKYSSIYYKTGCITVQYILPTRLIRFNLICVSLISKWYPRTRLLFVVE